MGKPWENVPEILYITQQGIMWYYAKIHYILSHWRLTMYKSKTIIFFTKYTKKVTMNVTFHNILNIFLEVVFVSNYAYKCTGKQSLQLVNF